MERIEADATPSEEWIQSLNATCKRLMTQYLHLLRSASSTVALSLDGDGSSSCGSGGTKGSSAKNTSNSSSSSTTNQHNPQHDPRTGGGHMKSTQDPPPPPLASDVAVNTLQCQLASENICVAASNILSLIRTLKLSLLLMDDDTIEAEEYIQVLQTERLTQLALQQSVELEQQFMEIRNIPFQD